MNHEDKKQCSRWTKRSHALSAHSNSRDYPLTRSRSGQRICKLSRSCLIRTLSLKARNIAKRWIRILLFVLPNPELIGIPNRIFDDFDLITSILRRKESRIHWQLRFYNGYRPVKYSKCLNSLEYVVNSCSRLLRCSFMSKQLVVVIVLFFHLYTLLALLNTCWWWIQNVQLLRNTTR